MNFIKKNKFTIIAIIIFITLVIVLVKAKELLVPDEGKASYGDRLEEIAKQPLDETLFTKASEKASENTNITNFTHQVHGKIINLIITVKDEVSIEETKKIASSYLEDFKEQLDTYTLQIYLKKENPDLNNFPIIGYKGPDTKELIFTKDREITKSEETDEK